MLASWCRRTTEPTALPVTLEEQRAHLRLTGTEEDELVEATLEAAVSKIEDETRRALMAQSWTAAIAQSWAINEPVTLPRPRLLGVDVIKYRNSEGAFWPWGGHGSQPMSEPASVWLTGSPADIASLDNEADALWTVEYHCGYGTTAEQVPAALRAAIKLLAAHLFEKREASIAGTIISEIPLGVRYLLDPYRVPWGGPNL